MYVETRNCRCQFTKEGTKYWSNNSTLGKLRQVIFWVGILFQTSGIKPVRFLTFPSPYGAVDLLSISTSLWFYLHFGAMCLKLPSHVKGHIPRHYFQEKLTYWFLYSEHYSFHSHFTGCWSVQPVSLLLCYLRYNCLHVSKVPHWSQQLRPPEVVKGIDELQVFLSI